MAIQLYPSADQRIDVVCPSDPAVQGANGKEVLERYMEDGNLDALTVPADATRFTLAPLTASAVSQSLREAGPPPDGEGLSDGDWERLAAQARWMDRYMLALCRHGLKAADVFPDVQPVRRGGFEVFPDGALERLPPAIRNEIGAHVLRISRLGEEGKASSGGQSGAAPKERTPSPAKTASARASKKPAARAGGRSKKNS